MRSDEDIECTAEEEFGEKVRYLRESLYGL